MALEGNFIRLNIHREWFKDPPALAKRLALILVGEQMSVLAVIDPVTGKAKIEEYGFKPYFTGSHWQLDSGNNWFLHERDGVWSINTRYWNLENLERLDKVLTVLLHGKRDD